MNEYDLRWNSPSLDSNGSMPIGNGDIGLNVWFEKTGELFLYISKTDSWDENGRLLKIGLIRVKLTPNPLEYGGEFTQTLRLKDGEIAIVAGGDNRAVSIKVWVDANHPIVRIELEGVSPFDVKIENLMWRTERRELRENEIEYALKGSPESLFVEPDITLETQDDSIAWCHRNNYSIWEENLRLQSLEECVESGCDPLMRRTFGAIVRGAALRKRDSTTLESETSAKSFQASIIPLCKTTDTLQEWVDELFETAKQLEKSEIESARSAHRTWWKDFWARSHIHLSGFDEAYEISQAYALQRWINACGGRGAYPIKFNGSIFNVPGDGFDADFRRWGSCYWFQNTRLVYWPMLASGDYELMRPLFKMYSDALPLAKARTKKYYGHEGAFFPETMHFWATYSNSNYGWDRSGLNPHEITNNYIRYYWQSGLELSFMMLDYHAHSQNDNFAELELVPFASATLTFFDEHWKRGENGKILFDPAMALETYNQAINPIVEIVAIQRVAERMLRLPDNITNENDRTRWRRLLEDLPQIPKRFEKDEELLAPAECYDGLQNSENPELYPVFPYRLYGVGKPNIELARRTFNHRINKHSACWWQDGVQAAFLGLAEVAANDLLARARDKHCDSRFPAFWGPNNDWIPDQDHGGNLLMTLQSMLLQSEDEDIHICPAWPKKWNVDFKLRASGGTTVAARLHEGTLTELSIIPEKKKKQVIIHDPT